MVPPGSRFDRWPKHTRGPEEAGKIRGPRKITGARSVSCETRRPAPIAGLFYIPVLVESIIIIFFFFYRTRYFLPLLLLFLFSPHPDICPGRRELYTLIGIHYGRVAPQKEKYTGQAGALRFRTRDDDE